MRMRKRLAALAAVSAVVLAGATAATAITNGKSDNGNHPYVGLMVALDENNDPLWRCSGSLLSETVFLTAAHCTEAPAAHVEVWFNQGPVTWGTWDPSANPTCDGETGYPCQGDVGGTPHPYPSYNSGNPYGGGNGLPAFAYRDVGVVKLTAAGYTPSRFAALPTAGTVDTLKNKTAIDFVGYGVQYQAQIPGNALPQPPPFYRWTGPHERMYAPSELVSGQFVHSAEFLRLSLNPGKGKGGTCFGDSGGPDLRGGSDTVLGVNSYVTNVNCSGIGYSQRVDIQEVLDWINSF